MTAPFKGTINVDIRDSEPDWSPFEPPKAPDGAPNVLYIVLDDVGFSAMSSIRRADRDAEHRPDRGRRGALHAMAHDGALLADAVVPLDGAQSHAELDGVHHRRRERVPERERHDPAGERDVVRGPRRARVEHVHRRQVAPVPDRRDERRVDTPELAHGPWVRALLRVPRGRDEPVVSGARVRQPSVDQPKSPEEGYHFTDDITDKALEFIKDAKVLAPDKPFFLYYAPGAAHAPHHVAPEWSDRFKGRFDMGYEAIREQTLARQKELGIIPAETELPPINPIGTSESRTGPDGQPFPPLDVTRPWDSLNDDERRLFARMAEVYAGFLAHADHHIGRLLDYLEETGQRENTIVVLVSDNGASGEGGPNGSVNENLLFNGIPDDLKTNLAMIDELGGTKTYNHYANGWAMAFNTPFKMWKRYEFNGGTSDACMISWPAGMKARGELRTQYHHAIDIVPTILDCLGLDVPRTIKGHVQSRMDGVSMRYSFDDAPADSARRTQFFSMLGSRGIWHDGWKAVTNHPTIAGWGNFNADEWELYHTDVDRSELHNLAAEEPDKLREMVNLWFAEAGANDAFPLDDRSPLEILMTPRPQLSAPRDRYVYYPDVADVPESQSVSVRNRSFSIGALVDIPAPGA